MLSERSQTQKSTYCGISFIQPSGKGKRTGAGKKKKKTTQQLPRAGDGEGTDYKGARRNLPR